jgi:hypothetical protein
MWRIDPLLGNAGNKRPTIEEQCFCDPRKVRCYVSRAKHVQAWAVTSHNNVSL